MCVMALIPAVVTECHRLASHSSINNFWPKGLALFFFWLLFSFQRNILLRKSGTLVLGTQKNKTLKCNTGQDLSANSTIQRVTK